MTRIRCTIQGLVQGVGFRPFVYRLANSLQLTGHVRNTSTGVIIEIEGPSTANHAFITKLTQEKPPLAYYASLQLETIPLCRETTFSIHPSTSEEQLETWIIPDVATCQDCLAELTQPEDRRYTYPFTNCTNCGPRFTIIKSMPYDRPATTMKDFPLCVECQQEYHHTCNRRFHAQPIACPTCGPQLSHTIDEIVQAIHDGQIVALKGLGGYQLLADATNETTVTTLRQRKHRPEKPLAIMCADLHSLKQYVRVSKTAAALLTSKEAPIVILPKKPHTPIAFSVAPDCPHLGCLLPYTPLHHLIVNQLHIPIICTSGNLSHEPIIIHDQEAKKKLNSIADRVVTHNRPIQHHADDSVIRLCGKEPLLIRRARGYAPLPLISSTHLGPMLALGGQQKNTISLSQGNRVIVSQHLGDMDNQASLLCLEKTIDDYQRLFNIHPEYIVCDAHREYETSRLAETFGLPVITVYHHEAHAAACLLDNQWDRDALVVTWDGTGLGPDNTIWGGEFLRKTNHQYERVASLKQFFLIGGDQAIKEPKRVGLALLYELYGAECFTVPWVQHAFSDTEQHIFHHMLTTKTNCVPTTSMGRLFDGIAALLNLKHTVSYEGQAAMMLEAIATQKTVPVFSYHIRPHHYWEIDWTDMVQELLKLSQEKNNSHLIASTFHRTVTKMITDIARKTSSSTVALTGGCFQNVRLTLETKAALTSQNYTVLTHRQLPPNDGNLSAGQISIAQGNLCV